MRFWTCDINPKRVARAASIDPGDGWANDVEIATPDGWQPATVEETYKVLGGNMNMDWSEATAASAQARLVAAGLTKAAATMDHPA